ncbi:MAG TPA: twin-arginine translocase TatA/TatE family subunit [Pseudomonadales bacterium]|jgi:sec-independent protein translocase protein TatA
MLSGISIWQLLIILAIVILIFGTKRLKNIGGDVGGAVNSFKKALKDDDTPDASLPEDKSKTSADNDKPAH